MTRRCISHHNSEAPHDPAQDKSHPECHPRRAAIAGRDRWSRLVVRSTLYGAGWRGGGRCNFLREKMRNIKKYSSSTRSFYLTTRIASFMQKTRRRSRSGRKTRIIPYLKSVGGAVVVGRSKAWCGPWITCHRLPWEENHAKMGKENNNLELVTPNLISPKAG